LQIYLYTVVKFIYNYKLNKMTTTETKQNSESAHLDASVEMIEQGVEKKSLTGASTAITKWITTLDKHKEFKGISGTLEKLKKAIADKDGKKIVELMNSAGEETIKAAEEADSDDAKKIKMLGKCLVTASKAISKFV
jgi:arginine deiminase